MVDEIVLNLSEVYEEIYVDPEPSIVTLRTVAHLGTHISARHSSPATPRRARGAADAASHGGRRRYPARDGL